METKPKTKDQMKKLTSDFIDDYGEILMIKANVVAINRMLMQRGKSDELFDLILEVMNEYREQNKPIKEDVEGECHE